MSMDQEFDFDSWWSRNGFKDEVPSIGEVKNLCQGAIGDGICFGERSKQAEISTLREQAKKLQSALDDLLNCQCGYCRNGAKLLLEGTEFEPTVMPIRELHKQNESIVNVHLAHIHELESQLSRYQDGVEVEGVLDFNLDRRRWEFISWNTLKGNLLELEGQRVRVLVMKGEE